MAYNDLNTHFLNKQYISPDLDTLAPKSGINELYPTVSNIDSIKQGLERLLTTPKGHNPFNREYGSSLYSLLFENVTSISTIQMLLYMDITQWEPRVQLSPGDISIQQLDPNTYYVSCSFRVTDTDVVSNTGITITRE